MFLTYILFLPITVIIVWLSIFIVNKRFIDMHDRIYMIYSTICAISYSIIIFFITENTSGYLFLTLDNLLTFLGLSICPLLFFYMRAITSDSEWRRWYWWLLTPALIMGITSITSSLIVGWDRILEIRPNYYSHCSPATGCLFERIYHLTGIVMFNAVMEVLSVSMILSCIYYLFRYFKHAKNFCSDIKDSSAGQMHTFLISSIVIIITLALLTFFIGEIKGCKMIFLVFLSLHISFWLSIMSANAYGIVKNKVNIEIIDTFANPPGDNTPSVQNELDALILAWKEREDKPYCREGISLSEVAQDIHTNTRVLSAHINSSKGINFRRWINILRIEESKRLMKEMPEEKLTYIAMVCGFADIATFSKTFRLIEGCSPQEFRQKVNS